MSIADMSFAEIHEMLPARTCMVCEKPIEEIGGRRMVAQPLRGTNVFDRVIHGGFKNFHSCISLLEDRELYLVMWGEVLPRPVASDYIFDDGGTVHCAILGADPGCWNLDCERHRPDQIRPKFL